MEHFLKISEPVALARPRGAHRLEVFSPKLSRRMIFFRRAQLDQWILLEADPAVITFCERPGYVVVGDERRLADFWVRFSDRQELVILSDIEAENLPVATHRDLDAAALPVRTVGSAEIAAAQVWIDNWQRMLPYIVANRDLISAPLSRSIERFLAHPRRLLEVEREFATGDPVLVRAALFALLHAGKVNAPDLHTQPLSLLTTFLVEGALP
ncbi:hypothetical protein [Paraburkholderia tropica]|uniref:hypothetical protein n=1 Tax=Paraburkholderia tropica TaxID=92647 RepID=UPI0016109D48|nr:hypothetical protein [Paraburkholderia tropica]MBB2984768.1 hypothetical protein [Paraburkholderia tropica]